MLAGWLHGRLSLVDEAQLGGGGGGALAQILRLQVDQGVPGLRGRAGGRGEGLGEAVARRAVLGLLVDLARRAGQAVGAGMGLRLCLWLTSCPQHVDQKGSGRGGTRRAGEGGGWKGRSNGHTVERGGG